MMDIILKQLRRLLDSTGYLNTSVSIHEQRPTFCCCCGAQLKKERASAYEDIGIAVCGTCNHVSARSFGRVIDYSIDLKKALTNG